MAKDDRLDIRLTYKLLSLVEETARITGKPKSTLVREILVANKHLFYDYQEVNKK